MSGRRKWKPPPEVEVIVLDDSSSDEEEREEPKREPPKRRRQVGRGCLWVGRRCWMGGQGLFACGCSIICMWVASRCWSGPGFLDGPRSTAACLNR